MLNLKNIEKQQEELESCLIDLSKEEINEEEEQKKYIKRLQDIYSPDFRHSYSNFYSLLKKISNLDNLNCLLYNLAEIKNKIYDKSNKIKNKEDNNFPLKIFKLADHLNLEISRYINNCQINSKTSDLKEKLDNIESETKSIKDNVNTAKKKLNSMQINIVAIIAIFSGIVLDFSGCMKLLGAAFEKMSEAPLPKLTFLILLVGFVLFNTIYLIFGFICKMNDRPTPWRFSIWFNGTVILAMITSFVICCFIG